VPFSQSAYSEARDNADVEPDKLRMIYLGVDDAVGTDSVGVVKQPVVLTVSNIDDSTLTRKGLLVVAEVSRLMPDVDFVIAGAAQPEAIDRLRRAAGSNVRFTGFVSSAELEGLMRTSKVIFQPSLHEGFGMSVAEAMLHGAIPVVSQRFSLPELVGDAGFYGDPENPSTLKQSIRNALEAGPSASLVARSRIIREFSLNRRRTALLSLVNSICPRSP
jgi:glycosyltransferase involved in cell wall biosynthesis